MSVAILDDHLLSDVMADDSTRALSGLRRTHDLATTNLYFYRLCRSVMASRGGTLTGGWSASRRRHLSRALLQVPEDIQIVPMTAIAHRMAEIAADHPVSTLGAEAVAAAEHLGAQLCVWEGNDGPRIRACASALRVRYRTLTR